MKQKWIRGFKRNKKSLVKHFRCEHEEKCNMKREDLGFEEESYQPTRSTLPTGREGVDQGVDQEKVRNVNFFTSG